MTEPHDEAPETLTLLAGEAVLGLLPAEAREQVAARAAQDPALARELRFWRDSLLELDSSAPRLTPSPRLWSRVEQSLATAPGPLRRGQRQPRLWHSLGFWRGLGAGLATACAGLLLVLLLGFGREQPSPVAVAVLLAPEGGQAGALVQAYADGSIDLTPLVDIPVPSGRVLQVWTLWDAARGPVPLGILPAAMPAHLVVAGLPEPVERQLYEITLEPAGGSPSGRPTGPVLYKGLAGALPR